VKKHDYILTPGRYVGFEEQEEEDEKAKIKTGKTNARKQKARRRN